MCPRLLDYYSLLNHYNMSPANFKKEIINIMEYISLTAYDSPEFVVPIRISLIAGCC
jgi:hypothetical protein